MFLPAGYQRLDEEPVQDQGGKRYWPHLSRAVLEGNEQIEFILVPQMDRKDPGTFYIMKNKVSVRLFRDFAAKKKVRSQNWNKDADAQFPALGVDVFDALAFAAWLQGAVPTADQWDRAAGYYLDKSRRQGEGPYRGSWEGNPRPQIAVAG